MTVWSVPKLGTEMMEILDCFGQSRDRLRYVIDPYALLCVKL